MCLSWSVDYKFSKEEGTSLVHLSHDRVSQMRHFKMPIGWMKGFPVFLSCSDTQRDTLFIYDVLWHELTYLVNVNLSWRMFTSQTGCHFTSLYSSFLICYTGFMRLTYLTEFFEDCWAVKCYTAHKLVPDPLGQRLGRAGCSTPHSGSLLPCPVP